MRQRGRQTETEMRGTEVETETDSKTRKGCIDKERKPGT